MSGCVTGTTFQNDVDYISKYATVHVLADGDARVAASPQLMGRIMTATFAGKRAPSLGYINRENIAKGDTDPVFNNHGGADRLWFGPEGGQFSIFFKKGQKQELANWTVPKGMDAGGMTVTSKSETSVSMQRDIKLINASETGINLLAQRTVRLVKPETAEKDLGVSLDGTKLVGYESVNKITNSGDVVIGEGCTVTNVYQFSGASVVRAAVTTLTIHGGTCESRGDQAITTVSIDGGTFTHNSSGTITTCTVDGGTVVLDDTTISRTVTTLALNPGGTLYYDPNLCTVTNWSTPNDPIVYATTRPA